MYYPANRRRHNPLYCLFGFEGFDNSVTPIASRPFYFTGNGLIRVSQNRRSDIVSVNIAKHCFGIMQVGITELVIMRSVFASKVIDATNKFHGNNLSSGNLVVSITIYLLVLPDDMLSDITCLKSPNMSFLKILLEKYLSKKL